MNNKKRSKNSVKKNFQNKSTYYNWGLHRMHPDNRLSNYTTKFSGCKLGCHHIEIHRLCNSLSLLQKREHVTVNTKINLNFLKKTLHLLLTL